MPGAGDFYPPTIDGSKRLGRTAPASACSSATKLWKMRQPHARFHLAGMVVFLLENCRINVRRDLIPVAEKKMDRRLTVELAQNPFQIVAPVSVQEHAP